jgi:hypothetical protein
MDHATMVQMTLPLPVDHANFSQKYFKLDLDNIRDPHDKRWTIYY